MKNIKQVKPKEYTFKSLPRLLDMIEPTSKAKAYCQKLIDTLEKEGYTTDAKIVGECLKKMNGENIPMAIMDEKHSEQKSNGKTAKRKFMVGDWITFYGSPAFKILKIEAEDSGVLDYLLLNQNGHDSFYNKEYVDKNARLWTIYDAKRGDILQANKCTLIFNSLSKDIDNTIEISSWYFSDTKMFFGNDSYIPDLWDITGVVPATKEQCDSLFAKMKEAGYEWDNDKKELMKKD